jgi:hypothetical protein
MGESGSEFRRATISLYLILLLGEWSVADMWELGTRFPVLSSS